MTPSWTLLGRTFGGRFSSTAVLGEGGMGTVLRGVSLEGGPDVAIKCLHPSLAHDPVIRARFDREARMAAQIDHPNAVQILDHGTEEGVPYLVMELVEGRDLFDVLADEGRLSGARAAAIAVQICDAVATAHDRGIIHRDLKPENVMLVGDPDRPEGERVKLLDFGVAKQIGSLNGEEDRRITMAGTIVGTPAYMSPEQCEGGVVDARSDVYACGALLYHLVTGRSPFEDASLINILYRHVHEAPRPPSELTAGLDPVLEASILKALAKRPEDRHQGAHELWEELLAMLPRLLGRPRSLRPQPTPTTARKPTWALPPPGAVTPPRAIRPEPWARRTPVRAPGRMPRAGRWVPVMVSLAAAVSLGLALAGWMSAPSARGPSEPAGASVPAVHAPGDSVPVERRVSQRPDR